MNTYDNAASTWGDKLRRLGYGTAYSTFLSRHVLRTGRVLDVGTGTGIFAQSWVDVGGSADLTLLDPSRAMLQQAQAQFAQRGLAPTLTQSGFEDLPDGTQFNAILAAHVFEHFAKPAEAMCSLAEKLATNGRLYLVISKPHWCNWLIWLRYRHRWFQAETICALARTAGLKELQRHSFFAGPPSRTSLGYVFYKP